MEVIGFTLAFIIGIVMGLIGAGGSILSSGLMVYIFGLNPVISASYTLVNVGVISLIGAIQYYRKNLMDITTGLLFSIPAIVTVLGMRAFVMPAVPAVLFQYHGVIVSKDLAIMLVLAALMIVIAWNMMRKNPSITKPKQTMVNKSAIMFIGLIVGILTGVVGVGGGFIIVPALFFFTGLDMKTAVGTSLFSITLNTMVGFLGDYAAGVCYNWEFLIKFIAVTVTGMFISGLLVHKIPTESLKKLFGVVILSLGCWIIIKELVIEQKIVIKTIIETPAPELELHGIHLWLD